MVELLESRIISWDCWIFLTTPLDPIFSWSSSHPSHPSVSLMRLWHGLIPAVNVGLKDDKGGQNEQRVNGRRFLKVQST
ncbi:unnamed protein product [Haemonchus placei]|uniref:Uncharacterized protein n=1 Tax=Haemonchus placei TaxID=6290 RepID=A0A3P8ABS7_HAEPC|nr:unnamed protein product [Haemonchus placei]